MQTATKRGKQMTTKTHKETIESHVDSNVSFAIDQSESYGGLRGAFDAFRQNTIDSCIADGYDADEALDAGSCFCAKFNKAAGTDY
jgi:hypothetical protein